MSNLIKVNSIDDILPEYKNTPIELLLEYHNLNKVFSKHDEAKIMIAMCADFRVNLWIPENFAFLFRTGGTNLFYQEFQVSYTIGVGGITHIALITNDDCKMESLEKEKERFIKGMVENAGWKAENAKTHFEGLAPFFDVGNSVDFVLSETERLKKRYPKVRIVPLHYDIKTKMLSQIISK